jgi:hypothetical protein
LQSAFRQTPCAPTMLRSLRAREAGVRRGQNVTEEFVGNISRLYVRAKLEGHQGCVNGRCPCIPIRSVRFSQDTHCGGVILRGTSWE